MRKFIGDVGLHGKGIGKRATFLFLYYSFIILNFNKVYIYSGDTNISNLNLNSKFGFELEGILLEDVFLENEKRDVVRMGLLKSQWEKVFCKS
jgi:RimJ/RimL family protein N-acetyltransferase